MVNRMEEAGYENYEFSNFSKPGFHAVNNANYWKGKAYPRDEMEEGDKELPWEKEAWKANKKFKNK